jgi:PGF-CTERM protein
MRKAVTTIGMATMLLLIVAVLSPAAAGASATRDLPDVCVDLNTEFTVAISASNYGTMGEVAETLCDGWTYMGSSLADSQVVENGNTVKFYLIGQKSFTYTVQAPSTEGDCCTISGTLKDQSQSMSPVGGETQVCVCEGDATPTPSATTVESPDDGSTGEDVVATPGATPTETGTQPVSGETVTSAPSVTPTASEETPVTTSTKKLATKPETKGLLPGFEAVFAIAGLLAVVYVLRRR